MSGGELKQEIEESACLRKVGRLGFDWMGQQRQWVFMFSGFLVFLAMIFTCISAVALSNDSDVLEDFPWSHGKAYVSNSASKIDMWIGLTGTVTRAHIVNKITGASTTTTTSQDFDSKDCTHKYCSDCKSAATGALVSVIFGLILAIPTLMSDITRRNPENDTNIEKLIGALGGILGGIATLIGLITFKSACSEELPTSYSDGNNSATIEWSIGVGYEMLITATCFLIVDGCVHLLTPSPEHCWSEVIDGEPLLGAPLKGDATKGDHSIKGNVPQPSHNKTIDASGRLVDKGPIVQGQAVEEADIVEGVDPSTQGENNA
jgi:hypothetical protein